MTVFAGVIHLDGTEVPAETSGILLSVFEEHCNGTASFHHQDPSNTILSFDIQVHSTQYIEGDGKEKGALVIAGDPLIGDDAGDIVAGLNSLQQAGASDNLFSVLAKARGVFSGVSVSQNTQKIHLFTDKLGIRPVFYYQKDNLFIYSSLLSVIEDLPFIDLSPDIQGMSEFAAYGFCLSNRSPYELVHRLDGGECLTIGEGRVTSASYWNWLDIPLIENFTDKDVDVLFDSFDDAVKIRRDGKNNAFAFLSGGLDSRVICSLVKEHVENVYTFNFSVELSQDNEFARRFSEAAGLYHTEVIFPNLSFPNWGQLVSDAIALKKGVVTGDFSEKLVWSGDGGSVGVGCVYMSDSVDKALCDNNISSAVDVYMSTNNIAFPHRFLKDQHKDKFKDVLKKAISEEFYVNSEDPSKSIYYFLMNNDQKRHMSKHFETICQHRVEFLLPFFDSDFLAKIYAIPTKEMLNHKFYMKWFDKLPGYVKEVPWQTYPGHVACPVEMDDTYLYQWARNSKNKNSRLKGFVEFLSYRKAGAVRTYFSGYKLLAAMILHLCHLKDFSYLVALLKRISSVKYNRH